MKILIVVLIIFVIFLSIGIVIDLNNSVDVLIYSSMEDFRNEQLRAMLKEEFPTLKIEIQYLSTSQCATKIKVEGTKTPADILMDLEYAYAMMIKNNFSDNLNINTTNYMDELLLEDNFYPNAKFSCGIIINEKVLNKLGLPIPKSYEDLLREEYKNQIIMPNPKASGTGYSFVKGILNLYGEEKGWEYFDKLNRNIKQYTSSGSGPVNSLVRGEIPIGIGMIFQAVKQINLGSDLTIIDLDEGYPYNLTANAVIKGKENKKHVVEVFNFIQTTFVKHDKINNMPENIYKEKVEVAIPNYPDLKPIDMEGFDSLEEKERILSLWKY